MHVITHPTSSLRFCDCSVPCVPYFSRQNRSIPFCSIPDFSNHQYMATSVTTGGAPDCVAQDVVFVEDLVLHFWFMLY